MSTDSGSKNFDEESLLTPTPATAELRSDMVTCLALSTAVATCCWCSCDRKGSTCPIMADILLTISVWKDSCCSACGNKTLYFYTLWKKLYQLLSPAYASQRWGHMTSRNTEKKCWGDISVALKTRRDIYSTKVLSKEKYLLYYKALGRVG